MYAIASFIQNLGQSGTHLLLYYSSFYPSEIIKNLQKSE